MTKALRAIFIAVALAACGNGKTERDNGRRVLYYDANLGSVVEVNDSIIVVFSNDGLSSQSKVINLNQTK